jgi:4-amino-4-deoxy-L-arabinose transferase-like glycosyltransferase
MTVFENTRIAVVTLAAILVVGIGLRFHNITERGIFDYDEAWYLLESKSLIDATGYFAKEILGDDTGATGLKDYLRQRGNTPITSFKPGHTVLVFLGLVLFGINDYATFIVSAFLGSATIWIVYRWGTEMFNRHIGLLSAAFLAASAFHVTYSRSGYAQAKAVFFVALGLYAWYHWRSRPARWCNVVAGLAIGYAFTCHFNVFTIPILIVILELDSSRAKAIRERMTRLFYLGAGMAAPLLMFELPARILAGLGALPKGQLTYYEQYFYRGSLASGVHLSTDGLVAILDKAWTAEGFLVAISLAIGTIITIRNVRAFEHRALLLTLLIPALPWCFLSSGLPPLYRTFIVLAIPASLIAGVGMAAMATALSRGRSWGHVAACVCVLASGVVHTAPLLPVTSGYREASTRWLDYVGANGGTIAFFPGSSWPIYYFYLSAAYDSLGKEERNHIVFYPGKTDAIPPAGHFDAVDIKRWLRAYWANRPALREHCEFLGESLSPVVRVPNTSAMLPPAFEESAGALYLASLKSARSAKSAAFVEIYDLRQLPSLSASVGKSFQSTSSTNPSSSPPRLH